MTEPLITPDSMLVADGVTTALMWHQGAARDVGGGVENGRIMPVRTGCSCRAFRPCAALVVLAAATLAVAPADVLAGGGELAKAQKVLGRNQWRPLVGLAKLSHSGISALARHASRWTTRACRETSEPEIVDMLVATMRGRGADRAVSVLKAGLTAHRVDPVAVDRELHGAHCALLVAPDPREMSCTAGCGRGDRGTLLVVDQRNDDVRWRTIDDPSVIQQALKHQLDVALQRIRLTPESGMAPDRRWFLGLVAPLKESHDRGVGNTDDPRRLLTYERIERLAVLATLLLPDTDLDVIAAVFDQRTSVARGNADRCLANIEVTGILRGGQKAVNLRLLSPRNPNNSQLWRY